jgi:putative ABC transport system substrate-binding protein
MTRNGSNYSRLVFKTRFLKSFSILCFPPNFLKFLISPLYLSSKSHLLSYFFILIVLTGSLVPCMAASAKLLNVSVIQIISHPALDETRRGIQDQLQIEGFKDKINMTWRYENAQGNMALALQIAQKFAGENADIIIAIPTAAAQAAISATRSKPIPIVFASVTDPVGSQIVSNLKKPGNNVTGVSNLTPITPQFKIFKKIIPTLKRIGVIFNPGEMNSVALNEIMVKEASKMGLEIVTASASKISEVKAATESLVPKVDCFFINNDSTALAAFDSIVKVGVNEKRPVFVSDTDIVKKGAVAAWGPNQYELGKQAGALAAQVLRGENPGDLPVQFPIQQELEINLDAARKMGVVIPKELIKRAGNFVLCGK